jgi:hypothetical protein
MNLNDESAVAEMLSRYGFDLGGQTAINLARAWGRQFDPSWLLPAVIESLDRGRYKAASVEQVLATWQRLGVSNPRFKSDFAAMVLSKIDASPTLLDDSDLNESLLDDDILSYQESIAVVENSAPILDFSAPVLAEDSDNVPTLLGAPTMSTSLIPTQYPPLPLRKPDDRWAETEQLGEDHAEAEEVNDPPSLSDTFTPSPQVSQFYYRLLAMADSAPPQSTSTSAILPMPPMAAEG